VVGSLGLYSPIKKRKRQKEVLRFDPTKSPRRQRWFRQGMRPLLLCGAAGLLIIVAERVVTFDSQRTHLADITVAVQDLERAEASKPLLTDTEKRDIRKLAVTISAKPPLWPVLLAGAAFLYLWWLAALIFDLAFVWQRYIRQATGIERMREWWLFQLPKEALPPSLAEHVRQAGTHQRGLARRCGHRPAGGAERHRPTLSESRHA
jgi:hypothetical protein